MRDNKIVQIVITILLLIGIFGEGFFACKFIANQYSTQTLASIQNARTLARANISIVDLFAYPEAPVPDEAGDIIQIDKLRVKINGNLTDSSNSEQGYYFYSTLEEKTSHVFTVIKKESEVLALQTAMASYFQDDATALVNLLPVDTIPENLTYYQQTHIEGTIPVIYDNASEAYYMFVDCTDKYYILHCKDPFVITKEKLTSKFPNAGTDPLITHKYNTYEVDAINNTRYALTDGEYDGPMVETGTVKTVAETYTDDTDNKIRSTLVSYGDYIWNADGTSDGTSALIDLTSSNAKASQWVLTETSYTFTNNGLTLNGLSAKRSSTEFDVTGKITNTLDSIRPYVIVIKYMDADNNLLGIQIYDGRSNKLDAKGMDDFTFTLESTNNQSIDITKITSVQFEIA